MSNVSASKTPWHLWAVGVVGLLWNGFGGYDFTMSFAQGEPYFRAMGMSDAQIAYIGAMPPWTIVTWVMGVWGAIAGTILLLLRSRWSVHAFAVSLAGLLLSLVYAYLLSDGGAVNGQPALIMNGVILAGCAFFLWYAWTMSARGVLR